MARSLLLLAAKASAVGPVCRGPVQLEGHGSLHAANAYWNEPQDPAGDVQVVDGVIEVYMKGRTYLSEECVETGFNSKHYSKVRLLGKRIRWFTDVSKTDCGCNAAFYLTSLYQNDDSSLCEDYYCDANSICGVRCTEFDLQEANKHAFHSALHVAADGSGVASGYGGGGVDWSFSRDWTKEEYGPGATCIDTNRPFEVEIEFPLGANGELSALRTRLSQVGSPCELSAEIPTNTYTFQGRQAVNELTQALHQGMTPIVSYWKAADMLWMDGRGSDGLGPCDVDVPENCGAPVQFWGFVVESLQARLI